jgi:acetyltransferase-like isoleucine patch superfamily enzyme
MIELQLAMSYFKHPSAIVESCNVGEGTRVWAFAHILPGAVIGAGCNICDHTFIENDVRLGDRVTVKCGVQLWDGITIEDDVFIGPNATFTNDPFPRSRVRPEQFARTLIRAGASIGANATVLPGLVVERGAMVGAGAVVTHAVPPYAIVAGNPARIVGYAGAVSAPAAAPAKPGSALVRTCTVRGVEIYEFPEVEDLRGKLTYGEVSNPLPFEVRRYFLVYGVATKDVRGEHAHRKLHQLLICTQGSCHVVVDDGAYREEFALDRPTLGIHVPPMVWAVQYKYTPDAVLLVLASDVYDADDYIRDYGEFLSAVRD